MKTKWEGRFFSKNQFDALFDSESNGSLFDFLAPFGGELLSARRIFYSTKKNPQKIFAVTAAQISDFQIALTHHQMALESRKYHHSTQNKKLHRTVS